jgi:hypothetical protein
MTVTNAELELRAALAADILRDLIDKIGVETPNVEQASALGTLSSCLALLDILTGERMIVCSPLPGQDAPAVEVTIITTAEESDS